MARHLGIQCRHSMGMGTSRRRDPPPRVLFTRTGIRPTGHRRLRPHRGPQPAAVARGQDGRHPGRDGRGGVRASRTRRHRERVRARGDVRGQLPRANPGADRLVCLGSQPVGIRLPMGDIGYGLGRGDEGRRATMGGRRSSRGSGRRSSSRNLASDEERIDRFALWMRATGGPSDAVALYQVDRDTDIRNLLPIIRVPTLIVHRADDRSVSIDHGRYVAQHIPGAEFVELPGRMHGWVESLDFLEVVERFVGVLRREEAELDRVLASILFTISSGRRKRRPGSAIANGRRSSKTIMRWSVACLPAIAERRSTQRAMGSSPRSTALPEPYVALVGLSKRSASSAWRSVSASTRRG